MTLFPKNKMGIFYLLILMFCVSGFDLVHDASNVGLKQDYSQAYQDLLNFKDTSSFSKYGLGQGGPHHQWQQRVREFKKKYSIMEQIEAGLFFGDLQQLSREYMSSKGAETEYTNMMRKQIELNLAR